MKIAMIVPYPIFPPDEGGRVRAYNLLKHLGAEHEMLLFTPPSPANAGRDIDVKIFESPAGRRRQIASPAFLSAASAMIRQERPDVLLVEFPWNGLQAAILSRQHGVPFVLDAHNVEGERFRRAGSRWWRAVSIYERLVTSLASRIFVVSSDDRARFVVRGVPAKKIDVVPNGVDPSAMHPDAAEGAALRRTLSIGDETRMLLFFGQLDYAPNREALGVIEREIVPRLARAGADWRLVICGKGNAPRIDDPRVIYAGAVDAMRPYINAADAVMVPVLAGGGTRLKILESIACGTPVVSTAAGAEGIAAGVCGDLLTVTADWDAFPRALCVKTAASKGNVPGGFLDMYSWATVVKRPHWPAPRGKHVAAGERR